MNNTPLSEIAAILSAHENILIITHIRPDGDTIGAALGLAALLRDKNTHVVCGDELPRYLKRVFGTESLLPETLPPDFTPDLVVSVDTATLELAGEYGKSWEGKIDIKLDHHPDGDCFAEYNYIDGSAAACAEIICDLAAYMGGIDSLTASPLYVGIVTDTGCFKYSNVTPKTLRTVAGLLETGMDNMVLHEALFSSRTKREITAMVVTYGALRYWRDDTVASIVFTNAMKTDNGLDDDDIGDISPLPRQIEGVELGITIKQKTDDPSKFKISMRSGSSIEANTLCALFDGGGHPKAAGGMIEASDGEEAQKIVVEQVLEALEKGIGLA